VIQARVQEVGPERFGIVAVDCAKARSKWMLCDFYGKVLVPPTVVEHQRATLELATLQLRDAIQRHGLKDHLVAVEMTGVYHRPVQRAFRKAGSETRLVHPFASRHYRLPAHADSKTDDHDLEGIFRATVNGFGLIEPEWNETYRHLQLLSRHRRDLVQKRAKLQSQIRQLLERCLPGYAALFPEDDLWIRPVAMAVARRAHHAEAIRQAGVPGVMRWLGEEKLRVQQRTVQRLVAWAGGAAEPDPLREHLTRVWEAISGRAGLFPSRYQSDEVDRADGPLARFRNARLRAAWMRIADNLIKCNAHYRGKFQLWKQRGVDARDIRCRIANRVTRTVFQMVGGRRLYEHPSRLDRQYVLDKLLVFHREHGTPPYDILRDLRQAAAQIPQSQLAAEAEPLRETCRRCRRSRRSGPPAIGEILVFLLAKLGIDQVQSEPEAPSPDANLSRASTR